MTAPICKINHKLKKYFKARIFSFLKHLSKDESLDRINITEMLSLASEYASVDPEFVRRTIEHYRNKFL
jgi:hypothetical protein